MRGKKRTLARVPDPLKVREDPLRPAPLTEPGHVRIREICPAGDPPFLNRAFFSAPCGMAEGKKAKTAEKGGDTTRKRLCPSCGAESRVVQLTGFGPRGFYWVCDKNCGYTERTR